MNKTTAYRNNLTSSTTAFATFAELTARCKAGYVPTLRPADRAARKLASILKTEGFRAWNPKTGQNW